MHQVRADYIVATSGNDILQCPSDILGAVAGAIYTLSLVRAGKRFSGQKLIVVNSVFGVVWGAGSISGPALTGVVVSFMGYSGLIFCLVGIGLIFLAAQYLSASEQHPVPTTSQ
ncbi:hypothetical protein BIY28_01790 [Brenneria goodwinii]|nr:hypothetical protein BIY28_01790 [Brenneria goodwinii]